MTKEEKKTLERYLGKLNRARSGKTYREETPAEKKANMLRAAEDPEYCVKRYFPHYATAPCAPFQIEYAWMVARDPNFTGFAKWGRGLAKSVWNNVIIPFWLWLREYVFSGGKSRFYFVLIGVSEKRAIRLLEDLRAEFEANPQIIADFGNQVPERGWEGELWITNSGFIGQALGFGQSCRGLRVVEKRPNHYNCDDLETRQTMKNPKRQDEMVEWVEQELLPSMDGDEERLCFSNNWFAPEMFLRKLAALHPDWIVHEVKAYNPVTYEPVWSAKYKPDYYKKKEKKMGILSCLAEYNHDAKPKGKIFKPEQIVWAKMPPLNTMRAIVGHWDVAYAGTEDSDYNAVRIWALSQDNIFWYVKSYVKRSKMREAIAYMCYLEKTKPKDLIIHWQYESQFWNDEVKRTLKEVAKEYRLPGNELLISKIDTPRTKKYDRMITMQPRYQNNRIRNNEDMKGDGDTNVGLNQLYGLEPNYTTHDDSPDADEQCLAFLEKYIEDEDDDDTPPVQGGNYEPINERI